MAAAPFGPVCFVEVKARGLARAAAEAVGASQQTRIARAASLYLASRPRLARRGSRFDIVAIAPAGLPVHHRDVWRPDYLEESSMALTVAIQMDPIEKIDIGGDSTFALALEAQAAAMACSITARAISPSATAR